ncbi:MAG: SMP-30/gluconolactonase/LRE family protein [Planctomycetia bacterium]|nr:SMP-30/gluconolactonase/LRE family protein [Planctomycetia bacterium]
MPGVLATRRFKSENNPVPNQVEVVARPNTLCGEGPIWDPRANRLLFVDNAQNLVYQIPADRTEPQLISRGLMVGGIALMEDDSLLFAGAAGVHVWRAQDDYRTIAAEHDGEPLAVNDITADPAGRLYAGTMFWNDAGMEKHGKLYLIDTDGSVHVVDEGIELSNGLALSGDGRTLYLTDSTARVIYAYDVEPSTGALSQRRVLVRIGLDEGIPDGLTIDVEGYLWSAQWYGAQVVRYLGKPLRPGWLRLRRRQFRRLAVPVARRRPRPARADMPHRPLSERSTYSCRKEANRRWTQIDTDISSSASICVHPRFLLTFCSPLPFGPSPKRFGS